MNILQKFKRKRNCENIIHKNAHNVIFFYSLQAVIDPCERSSLFELDPISFTDSDALIPHKSYALLKSTSAHSWIQATNVRTYPSIQESVSYKVTCSMNRDDKEAFRVIPVATDEVKLSLF